VGNVRCAWWSGKTLSLGPAATDAKSNKIASILEPLALLALKGCIVSVDATGAQRATAEQVVCPGHRPCAGGQRQAARAPYREHRLPGTSKNPVPGIVRDAKRNVRFPLRFMFKRSGVGTSRGILAPRGHLGSFKVHYFSSVRQFDQNLLKTPAPAAKHQAQTLQCCLQRRRPRYAVFGQ
jgi:predicted transposase YbfD/YdcC